MGDVCQPEESQNLEAERDRLGIRLGLTSPASRLGGKLCIVVMLGTGLWHSMGTGYIGITGGWRLCTLYRY